VFTPFVIDDYDLVEVTEEAFLPMQRQLIAIFIDDDAGDERDGGERAREDLRRQRRTPKDQSGRR
jgi:hypothetical protein